MCNKSGPDCKESFFWRVLVTFVWTKKSENIFVEETLVLWPTEDIACEKGHYLESCFIAIIAITIIIFIIFHFYYKILEYWLRH